LLRDLNEEAAVEVEDDGCCGGGGGGGERLDLSMTMADWRREWWERERCRAGEVGSLRDWDLG
jgi:hypothetical protein